LVTSSSAKGGTDGEYERVFVSQIKGNGGNKQIEKKGKKFTSEPSSSSNNWVTCTKKVLESTVWGQRGGGKAYS